LYSKLFPDDYVQDDNEVNRRTRENANMKPQCEQEDPQGSIITNEQVA